MKICKYVYKIQNTIHISNLFLNIDEKEATPNPLPQAGPPANYWQMTDMGNESMPLKIGDNGRVGRSRFYKVSLSSTAPTGKNIVVQDGKKLDVSFHRELLQTLL